MIKVSIILLNLNGSDDTLNCIKSIIKFTKGINYEIVLIDNASSRREKNKLKHSSIFKNPKVKIVFSDRNLGFGGGNNLGIKHSSGDYILILNNDTLFFENTLKKLLAEYTRLSRKEKIGFLQPRLYMNPQKTKVQQTSTMIPTVFQILQENFHFLQSINYSQFAAFRYLDWDRNSDRQVECVCGAAFFCERRVFEKIGLFDSRFKIYFEEYDLGKRAKQLHFKNFYTTKTSIIHLQSRWPAPYWYKKLIYLQSFLKYTLKII